MDLDKERRLIERSKHDPEAFGVLFDAYYSQVLFYVAKRTGSMQAAEDITAETFIKAYQNIYRFSWRDVSIAAWFYRIATNEIRDYFRHNLRYSAVSLEELYEREGFEPVAGHDVHQEMVDAQTMIERNAAYALAMERLSRLPMKYQEVVMLRFTEKKKLSDIALILDRKEGTVKSLLSRALARLRNELAADKVQPNNRADVVVSEDITNESYAE